MINLKPYLKLTKMMVLATKDQHGNPYTANVYYEVDDDYNFYFHSKYHREHSQHILQDEKIAWSIINTEKYKESDTNKKGLQFQGTARILKGRECEKASLAVFGEEKSYDEILKSGTSTFLCVPQRVKVWNENKFNGTGKVFSFS